MLTAKRGIPAAPNGSRSEPQFTACSAPSLPAGHHSHVPSSKRLLLAILPEVTACAPATPWTLVCFIFDYLSSSKMLCIFICHVDRLSVFS